ncbi:hypothetical protein DBR32_09285 [Taibaiella sp. KBW10]|uniref:DUF5683 domain-containing protein n=1 Tax=Taibaiella sp. KBW10 TaxID=2153357 RepID=UPI000F591712|nr:DUF5683 domain-containing protein [Taibaiella sp. KBW10]RQO30895.1 hypothetical protein DBR32_09285 [Taibaiella sp. KBW10]
MNHITVSGNKTREGYSRSGLLILFFLMATLAYNRSFAADGNKDITLSLEQDTLKNKKNTLPLSDSVTFIENKDLRKGVFAWKDSVIIPKRSAMYSMLFPGLGQLNNGQYWKLPIVYGLLGAGVYFFQDNLKGYNEFRRVYADRLNNIYTDKYVGRFDDTRIKNERDYFKKYLDMTVLISVLGYGLQIMDANVSAHLKHFDISEDISFRVKPTFQPTPWGISPGVGIAFNFKK